MHDQLAPLLGIALTDFAAADAIVNCDDQTHAALVDGMLQLMDSSPMIRKMFRDHITAVVRLQYRARNSRDPLEPAQLRHEVGVKQRRFAAAMVLMGFQIGYMRGEAAEAGHRDADAA